MLKRHLLALKACLACALPPTSGYALDIDAVHAGVRWRVGGGDVLGKEQRADFHEYDIWATAQLPWRRHSASGWGVDTRMLASAGIFRGAGTNALVVSVLPLLALGSQDARFTVDFGAGLAVLSRSKYGEQDFGGPLQAALTFGITLPLYRRYGVGYRFMHYSDAGAYGSDTIGADLHTIEMSYRF
jgi:hypothetical protein